MAGFFTNLGGIARGINMADKDYRDRERDKLERQRLEQQNKLLTAQTETQTNELDFMNGMKKATVTTPEDLAIADPDERLQKQMERARDFAAQNGRIDYVDKLSMGIEKKKQDRLNRMVDDSMRLYQESKDPNDLVKPFGAVKDGRSNFKIDGDDTRGFVMSYDMDGLKDEKGNPVRRSVAFKNRQELEEAAYYYTKPAERIKREIEFSDFSRKQGLLNDNALAKQQEMYDRRMSELIAKASADAAEQAARGAGGGQGVSRSAGPNRKAGDTKPGDAIKDMKGYMEIADAAPPPTDENAQPVDKLKGFEVYSRLRKGSLQGDDEAALALSLRVASGAAQMEPEINPSTGQFALYAKDTNGAKVLVDSRPVDLSSLTDASGKPLVSPEKMGLAIRQHIEGMRRDSPELLSDATVFASSPEKMAAAQEMVRKNGGASPQQMLILNTAQMLAEVRKQEIAAQQAAARRQGGGRPSGVTTRTTSGGQSSGSGY